MTAQDADYRVASFVIPKTHGRHAVDAPTTHFPSPTGRDNALFAMMVTIGWQQ